MTATATATATTMNANMPFMSKGPCPIHLLKHEAIDRLYSVVDDLPKYKKKLEELIVNFAIDDVLWLINTIYRDNDFKSSIYYSVYDEYFDEIEELIHKYA